MNDIIYIGRHLQTYEVLAHSHEDWELIYCTNGSGVFTFESQAPICYEKGNLVVVPPGLLHTNTSEGGFTNIFARLTNVTLSFTQAAFIMDDDSQHLLRVLEDIFLYFYGEQHHRGLLLESLANLLIHYIIAFRDSQPPPPAVERIQNHIVKNFSDSSYDLNAFLKTLPFSYGYLCRQFKQEYCMTPHEYLTNMRMQTAAKLLVALYPSYNIASVASVCGYDDPLYFSRVFKKYFGSAPKSYVQNQAALLTRVSRNTDDLL